MVSRETTPVVPSGARGAFPSERFELADRYVTWLADEGTVRGLIGPREVPRLWERHLLNSAVLAEAIPSGVTVADLGSGAGLPGLVLAIARPDLSLTLVEPLLRRTVFLTEVVMDLGLDNVEVVRERAEALHGKRRFEIVTSRALAPLTRLVGWSMPLVASGGALLAMKGSSAEQEVADAERTLTAAGCAPAGVLRLGGGVSPQATVVRVVRSGAARVDSRDASDRTGFAGRVARGPGRMSGGGTYPPDGAGRRA